jgi:uncharacterized protein (DUF488 family)
MSKATEKNEIFTIGHSTRSIEELISLLKAYEIQTVIDIRTIPKSRHNPQFNQNSLKKSLKKSKIGYRHLKELGGLRHPLKDSINTGWINASFQGYADYMQTPSFQKGLEKLETIAFQKRCALLCAEAVPWRCHRNLVADALTIRKWKVFHIQTQKNAKKHRRTPFSRIKKGILFYPPKKVLKPNNSL